MFQNFKKHFYSKVTFICVILAITSTVFLLVICNYFIGSQRISETLSDYNIALTRVNSSLTSRISSLTTTFSPIFASEESYDSLCSLFLNTADADDSESVLSTLDQICNSASYCQGCILLTRNGRLYQYNPLYKSLTSLNLRGTSFRFTPFQCQLLSDKQLSDLSYGYKKYSSASYGITGTLFSYLDNELVNLGYVIPIYSTTEFNTLLQDTSLDPMAVFSIADSDGTVLYTSDDNYEEAAKRIEYITESTAENGSFTWCDQKWYSSYIYSDDQEYLYTYQVPVSVIGISYYQIILVVFGIIISVFCILLYIISFRISNQKIRNIQSGMEEISLGHLDFRMNIPREMDEFTQIILYFNHMCDDLQQNIEKAYLFEISQRKAELYALQTSINPHFLYNSLEQIRVRALNGSVQEAANMLLLLSRMYRTQTRRNLYVSIAQECSYIENFMELYSYRYENFEYIIDIDSSAKKYGIPKNTLQPLVENYFVHGLRLESDDNIVSILCRLVSNENGEPAFLEFRIQDNGQSVTPDRLIDLEEKLQSPPLGRDEDNGFALSNVNSRLKIVFGNDATLHLAIIPEGGFCVSFCIPARLPEELAPDSGNSQL